MYPSEKVTYRVRLLICINLIVLTAAAQIIEFIFVNDRLTTVEFNEFQSWITNIENQGCKVSSAQSGFQYLTLNQLSIDCLGLGAYLGLLLSSYFWQGMTCYDEPEKYKGLKAAIRVILSLGLCSLVLLAALLPDFSSYWTSYAVYVVVVYWFGVMLFGFSDEASLRVGLY